jgi:hypothetical protein
MYAETLSVLSGIPPPVNSGFPPLILREAGKMNQLALNQPPKDHIPDCAGLMTSAERELNAFFTAIADLFGSEQAKLSADDWLNELMSTEVPPSSVREWRGITLKASARLAARVYPSSITSAPSSALASTCS